MFKLPEDSNTDELRLVSLTISLLLKAHSHEGFVILMAIMFLLC